MRGAFLLDPDIVFVNHGACDATWKLVCRQRGATYRRVTVPLPFGAAGWAQRLLDAATPRTRVFLASHITSTTALTFPVQALCEAARRRGITTLIDGAHAPGQMPLDLAAVGADFYTGNCHKWLCAPKGAAFLHARPGRVSGRAGGHRIPAGPRLAGVAAALQSALAEAGV